MEKGGYIYITTNRPNGVLYVGVTSNLVGRITQHKNRHYPNSFSAQYNLDKLVYFEAFGSIMEAIAREKQLKGGSRAKKVALIEGFNPRWEDLYPGLVAKSQ